MNTSLTSIAPTVNEIKRSLANYFIFTSAMLIDINQGCDLYLIHLLGSNGKTILIELVPELLPTSRS